MAITNKVVTVPILGHFKEKTDEIYVGVEEGKGLVATADITKLAGLANIKKVQIDGTDVTIGEDGTLNLDIKKAAGTDGFITEDALTGYLKTEDIATTLTDYTTDTELTTKLADYLLTATADGKYATKEEVKKIAVPIVEQSALEEMKDGSAEGAMAIVSDDNYHLYVFDGTDWQDTGTHVDLSGYLKSADAEGKYAAKTALDAYLKTEDIATTLTDYTTDTELTTKLADYLLTATADSKYATKDEVTNLGTILGDCTFEELETNKEGATKGDCYVVTDKDNHIYYYNGTDFIDTQTVIDLSLYLKTSEADSKYAKSADLSNYVLSSSLTEATEEDIDALFAPAPVM